MTDIDTTASGAIRDTGAGLRNNRSELLAAMAAEGELGRARQAAANERATARQEAMVAQAAQRAAVIGAPEQLTNELAAMQAARNFNLDSNRAYMDAAYERALESIQGRNDRYIEAIGEGAVLQANRLDADLAAQKQLLDAQAAAAAAARASSRGGGGGGGGSSMNDLLAQLLGGQQPGSADPYAQMMDELAANADASGNVNPALQDDIISRYYGQVDPAQIVGARNYFSEGESYNFLQGTLDFLDPQPGPRTGGGSSGVR